MLIEDRASLITMKEPNQVLPRAHEACYFQLTQSIRKPLVAFCPYAFTFRPDPFIRKVSSAQLLYALWAWLTPDSEQTVILPSQTVTVNPSPSSRPIRGQCANNMLAPPPPIHPPQVKWFRSIWKIDHISCRVGYKDICRGILIMSGDFIIA